MAVILLNALHSCSQSEEEINNLDGVALASKAQNQYYQLMTDSSGGSFQPASLEYVHSLSYPGVSVSYNNPAYNRFISVWEPTLFQKRYNDMQTACLNRYSTDHQQEQHSACSDSVWQRMEQEKIGDVPLSWIIRLDSNARLKAMLSRGQSGYQLGIFSNGRWQYYSTGLVENFYYYIKPLSTIPFLVNDSTFQAEAALVRMTEPEAMPVLPPKYELIKDGVILTFHLNELKIDTDQDGLTDVKERRLGTNPHRRDTDGDGIWSLLDHNPLHQQKVGELGVLYRYLLEEQLGFNDSCFVAFTDTITLSRLTTKNQPLPQNTYLIVTEDRKLQQIAGTHHRYLIMNNRQWKMYQRINPTARTDIHISPLFELDQKKHWYKVTISRANSGNTYLVIRRKKGWIIKHLEMWVV